MQDKNGNGIIKSVQKSLKILKHIMNSTDEVNLSELEKALGYNSSTIHHLLKTLMEEGFISQNKKTKKYDIGPEFLFSWLAYKTPEKYFTRVIPLLEECVDITGETTNMFIRDEDEAVCVAGSESKQTLRAFLMIGRRIPLPCTAVGKVFLAYMDKQEALNIIKRVGLKKYLPGTKTDIEILMKDLEETRVRGYSIEIEEFEEMITAVGAPVLDTKGKVISVISTIIPSLRADKQKIEFIASTLTNVSKNISKVLENTFY